MAFKEIQMWADIINESSIDKLNYDLACKKSISDSALLESQEFTRTSQRQLDPNSYGFNTKRLNESLYQKNGIEGRIALPSKSIQSKFVMEMRTFYPTIDVKPLVSGTNQGIIVEGQYDDLLDVWSLNESGYVFNDVKNAMLKESLKTRFDEAFFSEGCSSDVDPLDEKIDLDECGFGQPIDEYDADGEFGSITLDFELSDDDEATSQKFYEKATQEDGLYDISMSKCKVSGPYEQCRFTGSRRDLQDLFAIYNGCSSWSQLKQTIGADAEQDFNACYDTSLQEADSREPISHGLDCIGVKASTANLSEYNGVEMSLCESKRRNRRLHEGVLGALGGAALGGLVGAAGGAAVGDADKLIGHGSVDAKIGDAKLSDSGFISQDLPAGGIKPQLVSKSASGAGTITGIDGTVHNISGNAKFTGAAINSTGAAIGAGAGALAGGALGAMATSDDKKNEAEEYDYNPDESANDDNDAHSKEYDEMMDAAINDGSQDQNQDDAELAAERNEAEEFFGLNEDETPKSLEAKPFRVNWIDNDGKVHTSNVAATNASSAKQMISTKHDGCEVKGVEDLSNMYKQWQKESVYESMMLEASLADALGSNELDKLNDLEAKLSDDGMTSDERIAQQHKDDIEAQAVADMELPYEGMTKDEIGQELTKRHGFVGNELQLFWKVMTVLGYTPTDISKMRDEEVVDAITMHIPKGRKHRFYGYIDPMRREHAFIDDGGGQLDDNGRPNGKTGDWKQFYASVTPVEFSPAELDMMHNDQDIDDRRQQRSSIKRLDRQIKQQEQNNAISNATPSRGQDTWLTTEVEKWIKSMPRPEARKLVKSIIDDIKRENGITDKYITDKTDVPDDVKERCAQDILFLKTYFGKHVGMGPTLRDYPIAWGKDSSGEYSSHTTAGMYNDETDLMIRRCMATTMNVPFIEPEKYDETLKQIISDDSLKVKFIEEIMKFQKHRSYGSRSFKHKEDQQPSSAS